MGGISNTMISTQDIKETKIFPLHITKQYGMQLLKEKSYGMQKISHCKTLVLLLPYFNVT